MSKPAEPQIQLAMVVWMDAKTDSTELLMPIVEPPVPVLVHSFGAVVCTTPESLTLAQSIQFDAAGMVESVSDILCLPRGMIKQVLPLVPPGDAVASALAFVPQPGVSSADDDSTGEDDDNMSKFFASPN